MSDRSYRRRQNTADRVVTPAPAAPSEQQAAIRHGEEHAAAAQYGHSFDAIPIYAAPVSVQTKLTVNTPGDSYEQEAERVADQVMALPEAHVSTATASPPQVQRSSSVPAPDGTPATDAAAALGVGGQPLDTATRVFMEPRFGYDFGNIRIHTDSRAATAARSINAAAFTVGSDIAFGAGQYQPQSDSGRHLLAHELTHVVQQNGGGAGPSQVQAAPLGIQRAVETLGGEWDTDKYELVNDGTQDIGVEINKLRFKAKDPVDATKIGLTQMVNSIDKGSVVALNDTVKNRSIPAGEADAGSHMDRKSEYTNPIYGMADPTDKGKTLGGSVSTGNSEWGHHFKDPAGKVDHQDAALYDQPTLGDHGANASQIFETAALAIDGPQAGTYYGTVRWGWQSDAANKVTKLPLSVVAVGVPSATFNRAAELWNAGKSSTGADSVDLPIAAGTSGSVMPAQMTTEQIMARLEQIKTEIANPGAGKTIQTLEFEQRALKTELMSRMGDFPTPDPNSDTRFA